MTMKRELGDESFQGKDCLSHWTDTYVFYIAGKRRRKEDFYVIEVSLQFDLHPINDPGIAFAPPKKIGFSG